MSSSPLVLAVDARNIARVQSALASDPSSLNVVDPNTNKTPLYLACGWRVEIFLTTHTLFTSLALGTRRGRRRRDCQAAAQARRQSERRFVGRKVLSDACRGVLRFVSNQSVSLGHHHRSTTKIGNDQIVALLCKSGGRPDAANANAITPLHAGRLSNQRCRYSHTLAFQRARRDMSKSSKPCWLPARRSPTLVYVLLLRCRRRPIRRR